MFGGRFSRVTSYADTRQDSGEVLGGNMGLQSIKAALEENNYTMNVLWVAFFKGKKFSAGTLEEMQSSLWDRNSEASAAIAELERMGWISVSERLPEITEEYLCISMFDACPVHKPYSCLFRKVTSEWFKYNSIPVVPSHWMPLPEPPESSNTDFNLTTDKPLQVKS